MQCHDMQYNLRKFHYFYQCNNEYYRVKLLSKLGCADNGQTVTQAVHLSQYFAVVRHCPCKRTDFIKLNPIERCGMELNDESYCTLLHGFDELHDELDAAVKHLDSTVLHSQML